MASKSSQMRDKVYQLVSSRLFLYAILLVVASNIISLINAFMVFIVEKNEFASSLMNLLLSLAFLIVSGYMAYGLYDIYRSARDEYISQKGCSVTIRLIVAENILIALSIYATFIFNALSLTEELEYIVFAAFVMLIVVAIAFIPGVYICKQQIKAVRYIKDIESNIKNNPKELTAMLVIMILSSVWSLYTLTSGISGLSKAFADGFSVYILLKNLLSLISGLLTFASNILYTVLVHRFNQIMCIKHKK